MPDTDRAKPVCGPRPQAAFLTQLVACERRFEAYRRHQRSAPEAAAARYAGSAAEPTRGPAFQRKL